MAKKSTVAKKVVENADEIVKTVEEKSKKQIKKDTFKFFNDEAARIWYTPKFKLDRGENKTKKMLAYAFFEQKEPAIIKDFGHNEPCSVCTKVVMNYASLKFNVMSKEKNQLFPYVLKCVCEDCLKLAGVYYIHDYEVVGAMHNDPELAYRKIGDAAGHICEVCYVDDGKDATFVHVRVGRFLLPVPCCTKHLERFCGVGKMPELTNENGDLPLEWRMKLDLFNKTRSYATQGGN